MMDIINEMIQASQHPPRLHAMVVHFPIAISVIGLIMLFVLAFTGGKSNGWRWACVLVYAIGAGTAFVAFQSGQQALSDASSSLTSDAVSELASRHEEMGEKVWIFLAVTTVLIAVTAIPYPPCRIGFLVLSILAGIATAGWVAVTGHEGGTLVYMHGIGTRSTQAQDSGSADATPPPVSPKSPAPASAIPAAPAPSHKAVPEPVDLIPKPAKR